MRLWDIATQENNLFWLSTDFALFQYMHNYLGTIFVCKKDKVEDNIAYGHANIKVKSVFWNVIKTSSCHWNINSKESSVSRGGNMSFVLRIGLILISTSMCFRWIGWWRCDWGIQHMTMFPKARLIYKRAINSKEREMVKLVKTDLQLYSDWSVSLPDLFK